MTAEEAYKILMSEPSVTLIMFKGIMIGEALMMAIEALEKQIAYQVLIDITIWLEREKMPF